MCRPIRGLTQMKGFDITKHVLACFGGAGGQHACAIARALGMPKIFIHRCVAVLCCMPLRSLSRLCCASLCLFVSLSPSFLLSLSLFFVPLSPYPPWSLVLRVTPVSALSPLCRFSSRFSGILSAYGIGLADVVKEDQAPCACTLSPASHDALADKLSKLADDIVSGLEAQRFPRDTISVSMFLHLRCVCVTAHQRRRVLCRPTPSRAVVWLRLCRFQGTDAALMTQLELPAAGASRADVIVAVSKARDSFLHTYRTEFGFELVGRCATVLSSSPLHLASVSTRL